VTGVTGKPIDIFPVSDEALAAGLVAAGVPDPFARVLASVDANVRAGHSDVVNGDLERLSHRKPLTLEQFLETHSAALTARAG
jgi:NAD(P)H dehydrogenase (quinone)